MASNPDTELVPPAAGMRASMPPRSGRARPARDRSDAGESLIEILITVVITGLTVGALLASLASAGTGGNVQRSGVEADLVMRNFADAAKIAAQNCAQDVGLVVDYTAPDDYHAVISDPPTTPKCPSDTAVTVLTLSVSGPLGVRQTMQIAVRRP